MHQPKPLPTFRVIELGGPAGQYCGKLLADLGCEVICNGNFGYCSTAGRMLTDWLGTSGALTSFSTNYRAPAYIGDVLTARGVVTAKSAYGQSDRRDFDTI